MKEDVRMRQGLYSSRVEVLNQHPTVMCLDLLTRQPRLTQHVSYVTCDSGIHRVRWGVTSISVTTARSVNLFSSSYTLTSMSTNPCETSTHFTSPVDKVTYISSCGH